MIPEALAFALQNMGLISSIIQEGIEITPEIVKLIEDAYTTTSKIANEHRAPTQTEITELNVQEEYWRNRLQS